MMRTGWCSAESGGLAVVARSAVARGALGLLGVGGLFMAGCFPRAGNGCGIAVVVDTTGLRDGDLLFRLGPGTESRLVTAASRGVYSHVGIACRVGGQWMAVHAVPGENEDCNIPDTLKCEPLADFFLPHRAIGGARGSIACADEVARAAASYALGKVRSHVLFDHHYRMTDTTELYCTELVYHAYLRQGVDLVGYRSDTVFCSANRERYIFPSDLQKSRFVESLQEFPVCEAGGKELP